jgi:hypothetical protein
MTPVPLLKLMAKALDGVATAGMATAIWSDKAQYTVQKWMMYYDEPPSLRQWANRLIEHIESDQVIEAYHKFIELIRAGLSPEHAFHLVTK